MKKETEQVLDLIDTLKAGINLDEIKQWYQEDDILEDGEEQWKTIPTKYFPDTDHGHMEKKDGSIEHYYIDPDPITVATQYVLQFTAEGSYKRRVAMELVTSLILFNISEYDEYDSKNIIPLVKTDYYYKSPYAKNKNAIIRSPINFIRSLMTVGILESEDKLNKCTTLFGDKICKVVR